MLSPTWASSRPRISEQKGWWSECGRIRTDRRTLIAEKIGDAGGNAYMTMVMKKMVRRKKKLGALTRLTPPLRAGLAERV